MEQVWRDAPWAAMRVWEGGARLELNAAAQAWAARHAIGSDAWAALAARAAGQAQPHFDAEIGAALRQLTITKVALDGAGFVLWLEEALDLDRESIGERLNLLEEIGRMGVTVRDMRTGRGHWDPQLFRLFGLDETTATPTIEQVIERVHPEDRAGSRELIAAVAAQPQARRREARFRIVRPDGALRHVHAFFERRPRPDGSPGLLIGVLIDDSDAVERVAAERRVADFLDRALALAEVSVWRADLRTQLVHFNSLGLRLLNYDPLEGGVPLAELRETIHPEDLAGVVQAAEEAIASERAIDVVARYRRRGGGWRTLLTRRVADRDSEGNALALAGISIDISEQMAERERADAMRQQKLRAEQARRDQSAFLARISRELRVPMNALLGHARLLVDDTREPLTARQRQRVDHIRELAQQLLSVSEGVLEITSRDAAARVTDGAARAIAADAAQTAADQRLRLVCVEDNPVNMLLVRELLALRPQVDLHCAVDGLSGVELATQLRPQVMLLDLQLPDIGGHEVMQRVRSQLGDGACRFVALSANAVPDHIREMLALGFEDYWTKPIDFTRFLDGIDSMIAQHRGG